MSVLQWTLKDAIESSDKQQDILIGLDSIQSLSGTVCLSCAPCPSSCTRNSGTY
jgi:heterodisulfide reductase subunit C